jgi:hypothetical protein
VSLNHYSLCLHHFLTLPSADDKCPKNLEGRSLRYASFRVSRPSQKRQYYTLNSSFQIRSNTMIHADPLSHLPNSLSIFRLSTCASSSSGPVRPFCVSIVRVWSIVVALSSPPKMRWLLRVQCKYHIRMTWTMLFPMMRRLRPSNGVSSL